MGNINKIVGVTASALLLSVLLTGCGESKTPSGVIMTPVPTNTATAEPMAKTDAVKALLATFDKSITTFSQGGSQAVHIVDAAGKSSNIVAVNPAIYSGMVRLSIRDGKVIDPRADSNISTELNVLSDVLKQEDLSGVNVVYVKNSDNAKIIANGSTYEIVMIDNKVSKIVASGESDGKPVKINYVYTYGDHSYDEAIKIVADAVKKTGG